MNNTNKKGTGSNITIGLITIVLTLVGAVLYFLSHTTGYYIYGEMNSNLVTTLLVCALAAEAVSMFCQKKFPEALWAKLISFVVTALLVAGAVLIVGDRVEGIGNCIVTDYDSGHGGEEGIYMSLIGAGTMLIAAIFNIIGSFAADGNAPLSKGKQIGLIATAGVVGIAALFGGLSFKTDLSSQGSSSAGGSGMTGTFTASYNLGNGNLELLPDYQFLSANMAGLAGVEGRIYIDITLDLKADSTYALTSDFYVFEAGKRAEVGDPSGIGLVYMTKAEGSFTDNGDGTVTTAVPDHVSFEVETDTYSAQMKQQMMIDLGGSDADGVYDSADYPELFDYVPETLWELADGAIVKFSKPGLSGEYTISFNQGNGNIEGMPDYQFLSANMAGLAGVEGRVYIDVTLDLAADSTYALKSDFYIIEAGKRAEVGDPSGIGLIYMTTAEGAFTDNGDGTVTTAVPDHVSFEVKTDTYSAQMKQQMKIDLGGSDADGVYDSADYPELFDYVPETVWTLESGNIVTYRKAGEEGAAEEGASEGSSEAAGIEGTTIVSDDEATTITFAADGRFMFAFEQFGITEEGTYTYEGGVLTVTNPNGDSFTAEGDPLALHYVAAKSDQIAGDYTIPASTFAFENAESEAAEGVKVTADDGATEMTFNSDGTYRFWFESYQIEDKGTYTYADGVLTLTDANGKETTVEGSPLHLHYAYSMSDQLTGDFTIDPAIFG